MFDRASGIERLRLETKENFNKKSIRPPFNNYSNKNMTKFI